MSCIRTRRSCPKLSDSFPTLAEGHRKTALGVSFLEERMRSLAAGSHWGADYFPDVPVVTQDGKTLKFYADVVDASACFRR